MEAETAQPGITSNAQSDVNASASEQRSDPSMNGISAGAKDQAASVVEVDGKPELVVASAPLDESTGTKEGAQVATKHEDESKALPDRMKEQSPAANSDNDGSHEEATSAQPADAENAGEVEDSQEQDTAMAVEEGAGDVSEQRQTVYNIMEGFRVFCVGSGKNRRSMQKTFATMRYDLDKCNWEFTVKNGTEDKKMSLKEFCLSAGNNAKGKTRCRDQIFDAETGELVLWQRLDVQSRETRKKAGIKPAWAHTSANPNTYKSYKRRREESDSDDEEETSWARAQKQCEAQERFERNETFQARRKAEQEALNNSFFRIHGRKKEENESIYGLDLTSPVLLEGHGTRPEALAAEKAKRLHELLQSGKLREDGEGATAPYIRHEELNADSELLTKVSREFVRTSTIYVREGRVVPARASYDPQPSKEFYRQYLAGRIEAPAGAEHIVPLTPKKSVGRWSKTASAGGAGQAAQQHAQPGSLNITQTRAMNGSRMESGAWEWESEEIKLFDALFACYDDDGATLARLLRTKTERQVKEMVSRSKDDVRCEVCRNPEDEDKMILCDKCDKGYHTFCLSPPLSSIPEGDWFCAKCTAQSAIRADASADAIPAARPAQAAGEEGWWDTRSLALQELEQRAVDELVASVNELSFAQLKQAGLDEESNLSRLALHDMHWARVKSIFSVCLLTCPVPIRNEAASVIVNPLRRHLRVIVAAVRKAFALEELLAVSDAREQGLDKVEEEPLYSVGEDRSQSWIFQVNTQLVDLDRLMREQKEMRCLIGRHSTRIASGDRVYIWKGGEVCYEFGRVKPVGGGFVAVGHVQSRVDTQPMPGALADYCLPLCQQLQAFEKRPSCSVALSHVLASPASVSALRQNKACAGLPILISSAGSVFKLNEKQAQVLDEAFVAVDPSYSPQAHAPVKSAAALSKRTSHSLEKEPKEVKFVARGHFVRPNESDGSDDGEEEEKDSDSEAENSERRPNWMRQCAVVLAKMRRHRDAKPFQKPVDIAGLGLTDYLEILKQEGCSPIDFETIDSNLNGGVYKRDRDFVRDVRRVFYNASVYNPEDDPVYLMARNISGEFEQSWAKYKRDKRKRKSAAGPRKKGDKDAAKGADAEEQGEDAKQQAGEKGSGGDAMDVSVDDGRKDEAPEQDAEAEAKAKGSETDAAPDAAAAESVPAAEGDAMDVDEVAPNGAHKQQEETPAAAGVQEQDATSRSSDVEMAQVAVQGTGAPKGAAGGDAAQVAGHGDAQKRCKVCDGFTGTMISCDASGAAFHLACLEDPITHPPDGPWVSPMSVLQSKRKTQQLAGEDGSMHPACPACSQAASSDTLLCGGCKQKYHAQCVRPASMLAQDKICLCRECEALLPPLLERQVMLQVLLRREVLVECRRLLHLHCELCSRDRQRDLDTELHRFRVLKQTARLGDRIFEFNRVLLEEANGVLGQVFSVLP